VKLITNCCGIIGIENLLTMKARAISIAKLTSRLGVNGGVLKIECILAPLIKSRAVKINSGCNGSPRKLLRCVTTSHSHTLNANHLLCAKKLCNYNCTIKIQQEGGDRKSTRLNSSHVSISYAVFCL